MIELLSLDDIIHDGKPSDPLAVKELAEEIAENTLRVPVLLNADKHLIDGWRRVQAIRALGHQDILAQATDDFDLALDNLSSAHGGAVPGPRRLYELYRGIKPMGFQKLSQGRRNALGSQKPQRGAKKGRIGSFRHDFLAVFNVSEHYLQGCLTFYSRIDLMPDGPERDQYLAASERVERGEITPLTALKHLALPPEPEKGPMGSLDAGGQRELMSRADLALDSTLRAIEAIADVAPGITDEDLKQWAQNLRERRRKLTQFINSLEKAVD
jgi:hypothetical protein